MTGMLYDVPHIEEQRLHRCNTTTPYTAMKLPTFASVIATTATISTAQYLPFLRHDSPVAMADQIQMQPDTSTGSSIRISDVLGGQRSISTFASLTRDVDDVSTRLDNQGANTTLLAPLNSAMSALPRKPWEDPRDYAELGANAYEGNQGPERAARNIKRFVEAHVIPKSPWEEKEKVKSLAGEELWWESRDGSTFVMPGKVEVERIAKQVGNGEVWILQNVVNYT